MSVFHNNILAGASGAGGAAEFQIDRSLRFVDGDSAYLNRTPSSAGNETVWTASFWIKLNKVDGQRQILTSYVDSSNDSLIKINSNGYLEIYNYRSGAYKTQYISNARFRDHSSWYHFVISVNDSTSLNAWVNGVAITFSTSTGPDGTDWLFNGTNSHQIGRYNTTANSDFQLAEFHFVDNEALAPTDFGEFDEDTGAWKAIDFAKADQVTYETSTITNVSDVYKWSSQTFSDNVTTSTQINSSLSNVDNLFDSNTSNSASTNSNGSNLDLTWTLTLEEPVEASTVKITGSYFGQLTRFQGSFRQINADGNEVGVGHNLPGYPNTPSASGTTFTFTGGPIKLKKISMYCERGRTDSGINYTGVFIDGVRLQDDTAGPFQGKKLTVTDNTDLSEFTVGLPVNNTANTVSEVSTTSPFSITVTNGSYTGSDNSGAVGGATTVTQSRYGYGTNGFHLDFSDNSSNAALGYDAAGSNNWTVNNLTASELAAVFLAGNTSHLTGSPFNSTYALAHLFDSDKTNRIAAAGGSTIVYTPSPAITADKFRFHYQLDSSLSGFGLKVNDVDYTSSLSTGSNKQIDINVQTLTKVEIRTDSSNQWLSLYYIEKLFEGAGTGTDSLIDTPTNYEASSGNHGGNYATINPLSTSSTLNQGNLQLTTNSGLHYCTIGVSSGKWYAEWTATSAGSTQMVGVSKGFAGGSYLGSNYDGFGYYGSNGQKYNNSGTSYGATYGSGDVIGVALNLDDGNIVFYKNGTSQGTAFTGLSSGTYFFAGGESSMTGHWNFGQRPFLYTPPTNHVSLCTQNLPEPTIPNGLTAFEARTYTGVSGASSQTGYNFGPDFVWIKRRNTTNNHTLTDSVRGAGYILQSHNTNAEIDNTAYFTGFTSDGYSFGTDGGDTDAANGSYVAWAWDGGDLAANPDSSTYNTSQDWLDGTFSSPSSFHTSVGFDGSEATYLTGGGAANQYITWTPNTAISYTTSVRVKWGATSNYKINGGSAITAGAYFDWETILTGSGTLTSLAYTRGDTAIYGWSAIEVDGKILLNPGVVPIGGLNSSVYNQSHVISPDISTSSITFGANQGLDKWFNGQKSNKMEPAGSGSLDFTSISALQNFSGTLQFAVTAYNPGSSLKFVINASTDNLTFQANTFPASGGFPATLVTIPVTSLRTLDFTSVSGQSVQFWAVYLDGKILVDAINDSETWSDDLTGTGVTNPTNGFDGDVDSYSDSTGGWSLDLSGHTFGTGSHDIEVKSGGATSITVNGSTSLTDPGGGGAKVWTGSHTGEITSIASSSTGASVYYIKIDDKFLLDTGENFVDDVPSIPSTVRANTSAGFSIVTAKQGSGNSAWAHGLNAKPDWIVMKARDQTYAWYVSHSGLDNQSTKFLRLNLTNGVATNANWFASTEPTSSVITSKASGMWNSGDRFVAYCWNSVDQYSSFGSYSGNGNANGTFVFTGFKVAYLLIKESSGSDAWIVWDNARQNFNAQGPYLQPQSNTTEGDADYVDFLSNGFKWRTTNGAMNASGSTYVYAAFSDKAFSLNGGIAQ